jgi:hypothetical protein
VCVCVLKRARSRDRAYACEREKNQVENSTFLKRPKTRKLVRGINLLCHCCLQVSPAIPAILHLASLHMMCLCLWLSVFRWRFVPFERFQNSKQHVPTPLGRVVLSFEISHYFACVQSRGSSYRRRSYMKRN